MQLGEKEVEPIILGKCEHWLLARVDASTGRVSQFVSQSADPMPSNCHEFTPILILVYHRQTSPTNTGTHRRTYSTNYSSDGSSSINLWQKKKYIFSISISWTRLFPRASFINRNK